MALIGTEIVIQKLEARLRLHLWQSNEHTPTQFWAGEGIQCVGRQEWMQSLKDRCFHLYVMSSYKVAGPGSGLWWFISFNWPSPKAACTPLLRLCSLPTLCYPNQIYTKPIVSFGINLRRDSIMRVSALIQAQTEKGSACIRTRDGEFELTVPDEAVSRN